MEKNPSSIKFLGTAGARFVMIKQLRSSGGIWINSGGQNIILDPGPGSIVHCSKSRPRLDPTKLDAIILSHKHLDHSGDVNVMIEAMTEGGFKKRGIVFCPADALGADGVILRYLQNFPEAIKILKPDSIYSIGGFTFETSMRHIHPVETYGLKFRFGRQSISYLVDTKYFPGLKNFYNTQVLIMSVVFAEPRPHIDHLSIEEVKKIIRETNPKKVILTHFGMTMLKAKPHLITQQLTEELGVEVIAAYDGMTFSSEKEK